MSDHEEHSAKKYWKIYWILLVLLILSILGPEISKIIESASAAKILLLTTAFGIAIVKAYMVCAYFMHLNTEKKYVWYLLGSGLLLLLVVFTGFAPDVMHDKGERWEKTYVDLGEVGGGHHGDEHADEGEHSDEGNEEDGHGGGQ